MTIQLKWHLLQLPTNISKATVKRMQRTLGQQLVQQLQPGSLAYHRLGQPYFAEQPELGVSISHTEQLVVAVVAPHAVGIDIEFVRPLVLAKIRRAFTDDEWAYLQTLTGNEQLNCVWRLWTIKEAVLKLMGCGLTRSPRKVAVQVPQFERANYKSFVYQLTSLQLPDRYIGTLVQLKQKCHGYDD
ncbi:4'-phosphopantetheinyl transferase family protein [Lactiplantibacillus herbarum]|uniref:4'-phosphopantetheinyl transferase family protein n=1 Tax=Lactiplantibacillus herbarum TaxID=1670446 RepID=UPI00064F5349|nr:4'-phosphopantetheinyl transferase superfamily protein [Lactiplantibacillus herbarum]